MFSSIEATLSSSLVQIGINGMAGSTLEPISINQRMQTWFNFTHSGIMTNYKFDLQECIRHNKNWIDVISPETISFYNDYFVMNGKQYGRVMYISKHAQSLESDTIAELAKINSTNYITINNELLDLSGYKQEITRKHSSVGLQIEREKKRNRDNHDFLADANDKLLSDKDSLIKLSRQVESGDDHFFNTTIMIMFLAKSMQELDEITEQIIAVGGVKSFEVKPCFHMQRQGINSTLSAPYYKDRIVEEWLTDRFVKPFLEPKLHPGNVACQEGKGPPEAQKIVKSILEKMYQKYGTDFYVLQCDIQGYYDNVNHERIKEQFSGMQAMGYILFMNIVDGWKKTDCYAAENDPTGEYGVPKGNLPSQWIGLACGSCIDHFFKQYETAW